jgi:hypothetical protein
MTATRKLLDGALTLFIDQYGTPIWARTVKELREKCGGGHVFKIYSDKMDGPHAGRSVHCGYGVGRRWFYAYKPLEVLR